MPTQGTSFAAPSAMRAGVGVKVHLGDQVEPLAIKALLVHHASRNGLPLEEVGWGRVPTEIGDLVIAANGCAHILYQGTLTPKQWLRAAIPLPRDELVGRVHLSATFCFMSPVDPQDAINYTRAGLEIVFRPNANKVAKGGTPESVPFFQLSEVKVGEDGLRSDGLKWETVLSRTKSFNGPTLHEPTFDIYYHTRKESGKDDNPIPLPYALIVTVDSRKTPNLYNEILTRYRGRLKALRPRAEIRLRTRRP